jgi:exonuclease VII large subunit
MTKQHDTQLLAILLRAGEALCFRKEKGKWEWCNINSERRTRLQEAEDLKGLLHDLCEEVNQPDLAKFDLYLLYDAVSLPHLEHLSKTLHKLKAARFQVLRLEPLADHAERQNRKAKADEDAWLREELLPALEALFSYDDASLAAARKRAEQENEEKIARHRQQLDERRAQLESAHEETLESLRAKKDALRQELEEVREQLWAMGKPQMEHLLSYLPVIYRNVWGTPKPVDVALLAGHIEPPAIPSPYPEPSADTVLRKRRELGKLPRDEQERLRAFCRNLPHTLEIRLEMRDFLAEQEETK